MEVMVVMAIIAVAGAIAIPVTFMMIDDWRASTSSDLVRGKAAEARAKAMETGKPWRFAFIPNTGVFQLAPDDATEWDGTDQSFIAQEELYRDSLPKDVYFGINAGDIRGGQQPGSPGSTWQTIAVYNYEGNAREDTIVYFGRMGTPPMAIEVRGLTGSVTARSAYEVTQMPQMQP
jgi:type II secretory pathway pseudopilin PulG